MLCFQSLFNRMVPGTDVYELFCQAEGFLAHLHINDTEREPHALTTLMSQEEFKALEHGNPNFKKLCLDIRTIYSAKYNDGLELSLPILEVSA